MDNYPRDLRKMQAQPPRTEGFFFGRLYRNCKRALSLAREFGLNHNSLFTYIHKLQKGIA